MSILLVMGVHAHLPRVQGGITGVDVFFVLSGFLITALAINEWDSHGGLSLSFFYARRALRLFPALTLAIGLALVVVAAGLARGQGHDTVAGLPFVVFYLGDYARAFGPTKELGLLGITWSLAVEEQFYLLWPVVLIALLRLKPSRRAVASVLAVLALSDETWRALLVHTGQPLVRYTFAADARCDGLLLGCAVAFWLTARPTVPLGRLLRFGIYAVTAIGLSASAYVVDAGSGANRWTFSLGISIVVWAVAGLVVIIVAAPLAPLSYLLEMAPMRWLGRRSYGMYLYHYPILVAIGANGGSAPLALVGLVLALGASALSWRFVERPCLQYPRKFRPYVGRSAAT